MQYVFNGFTQDTGYRVFAFEGIAPDRARTAYSVTVDLSLSRKYGIRVQELPLLCRAVLERDGKDGDRRAFTYSEDDMSLRAIASAASQTAKRRPPRPISRAGRAQADAGEDGLSLEMKQAGS
jgi:hypothetical protein